MPNLPFVGFPSYPSEERGEESFSKVKNVPHPSVFSKKQDVREAKKSTICFLAWEDTFIDKLISGSKAALDSTIPYDWKKDDIMPIVMKIDASLLVQEWDNLVEVLLRKSHSSMDMKSLLCALYDHPSIGVHMDGFLLNELVKDSLENLKRKINHQQDVRHRRHTPRTSWVNTLEAIME